MEFSISQMAQMHGITRQTLIYYDKIGLFCPTRTDGSGARFYTAEQMPVLREICMLKRLDVPLKEIRQALQNRDRRAAMEMLQKQLERIHEMQARLSLAEMTLQNRLELYRHAGTDALAVQERRLFVEYIPERWAVRVPWPGEEMDSDRLHLCFVEGARLLQPYGLEPNCGIGALLPRASILAGRPLRQAGSLFFLPQKPADLPDAIHLPAGSYLCMFFCGMPYKLDPVLDYLQMVKKRGFSTVGDLVSMCILDGSFYSDRLQEDFCQFQWRIVETGHTAPDGICEN